MKVAEGFFEGLSNYPLIFKSFHLFIRIPQEVGQNFFIVLSQHGRWALDADWTFREGCRRSHHLDWAVMGVIYFLYQAQMLYLRVAEDAVKRIDRPAGNSGLVK